MTEPTEISITFQGFFGAKSEVVYRALYASLGDADLAEEATAEGFAAAFARWNRVGEFANPTGWVYRVGLNWATSRLRRNRFRDHRAVPESPVTDPEPLDPRLIAEIRRLNRDQLAVVVLRFFLDLDQQSIAEVLGVPIGTVRSRLSRALGTLKRRLDMEVSP